jgi:hypothetical protein
MSAHALSPMRVAFTLLAQESAGALHSYGGNWTVAREHGALRLEVPTVRRIR